jgi:hypothetical protein
LKSRTIQRLDVPTVMLIGLPEPHVVVCADVVATTGFRVLRVAHAAAAAERIPVIMPKLVVVSSALPARDHEALADRCVAVGAELLTLGAQADDEATRELVRSAISALQHRGGFGDLWDD